MGVFRHCATINAREMETNETHLFILFLSVAVVSPQARASVATLGQSTETITFTGLGGTPSGQGQSRVTWGSCAFDGTRTKCTVSGRLSWERPESAYGDFFGSRGDLIFFNLTSGSLVITFISHERRSHHVLRSDHVSLYVFECHMYRSFDLQCRTRRTDAGATLSGPITGTYDTTPVIRTASGVISASDYGAFSAIAPATWIEIYGSKLATTLGRAWGGADFAPEPIAIVW